MVCLAHKNSLARLARFLGGGGLRFLEGARNQGFSYRPRDFFDKLSSGHAALAFGEKESQSLILAFFLKKNYL